MSRKFLIFINLVFCACGSKNRFSNDFEGGTFSMTIYDCDHAGFTDDLVIERKEKEIIIKNNGGLCLLDCYNYSITGQAHVNHDTVFVNVSIDKEDKSDQECENECTCPNDIHLYFNNFLPPNTKVVLNNSLIEQ